MLVAGAKNTNTFEFSSISRTWMTWSRMEHMSLIIIFFAIFGILLNAHVVQFGNNFDNHVEMHLTYRKR
jgi:hypothetical protein